MKNYNEVAEIMKATLKQIADALTNQMQINNAEDKALYDCIRTNADEAIDMAGMCKSQDHFTKADWLLVHREIQKLIK